MCRKFNHNSQAIEILLLHKKDIEQASDFAERVHEPEVYSKLAKSLLKNGQVTRSVDLYIKANDPENFREVIDTASRANLYDDLVRYLQMCSKKIKDSTVDSELVYAYAKTERLSELEQFIAGPNSAEIAQVVERCCNQGLYKAATLLSDKITTSNSQNFD